MTVTLDLSQARTSSSTRRGLSDLSLSVAKSRRIVVVTGAGISCSCGIPDFRSSDGLYALVKQQYPDVVLKGRDLFDASLFRDATSTAVFYTFISQLKRSIDAASPSPTHQFIQTLDSKKKLLRSYTQNIDGLEDRAGLLGSSSQEAKSSGKGKSKLKTKDVRNVQLHGDIHRVRCMSCSAEYPCTEEHLDMFQQGTPPSCPECLSRADARRVRAARPLRVGSLRPGIVLYDEPHPLGDEIGTMQTLDLARKPDMLIVMGTSLKVFGLKKLVKDFAKTVRSAAGSSKSWAGKVIFVNKTAPAAEWSDIFDYHVAGETDAWATKVTEDWRRLRPEDWEIQQTLVAVDGDVSMSGMKVVKGTAPAHKAKGTHAIPRHKRENIPAPPGNMVLSTPDVLVKAPSNRNPPLSPSKRRQSASHYSELENSPSKRRSPTKNLESDVGLLDEERKLLFADSTNNAATFLGEIADLSMQDLGNTPSPSKPKADTKAKARRTRSQAPAERIRRAMPRRAREVEEV